MVRAEEAETTVIHAPRAVDLPLTLRWLGQAGFVLSGGGSRMLVDPWLTAHPLRARRPVAIADLPDDIRWLLATHEHGDHLDLDALPALLDRFPDLDVVVPSPLCDRVIDADRRARVHGVQPGDRIGLGDVTATVVHAWHGVEAADGYSNGHGLRGDGCTPFVGFVLEFPGLTAYHAGDTIADEGLVEELRPLGIDVALLPVNGRDAAREAAGIVGNLDAREAAALASAIGARILVPMHHDMVRGNRARIGRAVEAAVVAPTPLTVVVPARGVDIGVALPHPGSIPQRRTPRDRTSSPSVTWERPRSPAIAEPGVVPHDQ
jgi:L-ascorbate 6-phosphate lactonase